MVEKQIAKVAENWRKAVSNLEKTTSAKRARKLLALKVQVFGLQGHGR